MNNSANMNIQRQFTWYKTVNSSPQVSNAVFLRETKSTQTVASQTSCDISYIFLLLSNGYLFPRRTFADKYEATWVNKLSNKWLFVCVESPSLNVIDKCCDNNDVQRSWTHDGSLLDLTQDTNLRMMFFSERQSRPKRLHRSGVVISPISMSQQLGILISLAKMRTLSLANANDDHE